MNKNQFFYKRTIKISDTENKVYEDSFNINKVIRTIGMENDTMMVVLDDFHEESEKTPVYNKQGIITSNRNEKFIANSQIILDAEDTKKFKELMK